MKRKFTLMQYFNTMVCAQAKCEKNVKCYNINKLTFAHD